MLRVFMRVPGVDRIDFSGVLIIRLVHMCPILPNRTSKFRKKCSVCLILENRSCVMREMFGCPILQKRTHWGRTGWVV